LLHLSVFEVERDDSAGLWIGLLGMDDSRADELGSSPSFARINARANWEHFQSALINEQQIVQVHFLLVLVASGPRIQHNFV
jgi:hypothetical protein